MAPTLITGRGLVTPLGACARSTWASLLAGRSITTHARACESAGLPNDSNRIFDLAARAAEEAIRDAGWSRQMLSDDETALVVGTSKGPIENWLTALSHMSDATYVSAGELWGLHEISTELAARLGIRHSPRRTYASACASGLHALIGACLLIRQGAARRAIVVAVESSLHPIFTASFARMGVMARDGCRPFDERRDGFVLSEAAAAVCLETVPRRPAHVAIDRLSLAADPTHLTGVDPSAQTLRHVIRTILAGGPVDVVHAHGTGTDLNDPAELAAIDDCLADVQPCQPDERVPVYSHKAALGHSLGAAGLVSVVLNVTMHEEGIIPPNAHTSRPLPSQRLQIANQPENRPISRSLALAAGFGGAVAGVSLRTCPNLT
jgi:3-oxoacyl-[acyl-carrier-protein] synthase II